jgi:hypothetical protein
MNSWSFEQHNLVSAKEQNFSDIYDFGLFSQQS